MPPATPLAIVTMAGTTPSCSIATQASARPMPLLHLVGHDQGSHLGEATDRSVPAWATPSCSTDLLTTWPIASIKRSPGPMWPRCGLTKVSNVRDLGR
jgi:hypothetical protein